MSAVRSTAIIVLAALMATVLTVAAGVQPAQAQERAACGDGVGNALAQWRDNSLGQILGEFSPWVPDHPYSPEGLDAFWDRCGIDPVFPSPEGPPPPGYGQSLPGDPRGRRGSSSGDPHIVTQDGVRYDFHASGDFTLLETADGSTTVQVRYRGSGAMTTFDGIAVSVDGVTFSMNRFEHGSLAEFYVGSELIDLPANGMYDLGIGFVLHYDNTFTVRLNSGISMLAQRSGLSLFTPNSLDGTFVGLHGNGDGDPTNDLVTRSGDPIVASRNARYNTLITRSGGDPIDASDNDALYGDFMDSWAVSPGDSLFGAPGQVASPPTQFLTLADFNPATIELAAAVCTGAGLQPGEGLDECIFDVAVSGDPVWAQDIPSPATTPAIPAALLTASAEAISIEALTSVTDSFDTWQTKTFSVAASDVERTLRVQPECQAFGAPIASIVVGGQSVAVAALTCGAVIAVPTTAFELRIANPSKSQREFAFTLGQAGPVDLGMISSGDNLVGTLQANERATGQLDFDAADRVFLAPGPLADCSVSVSITDAAGTEVATGLDACISHGPIPLGGDAPFTIDLQSSDAADYDLTVTTVQDDVSRDIAVGQEVALAITTPGQAASVSLSLQAGERVYIETLQSIPGRLKILAAGGTELKSALSINDLGLIEAPAAGDYTMVFEPNGAATGTQLISIVAVADDTNRSASLGQVVDLQITTPGQLSSVTIELAAGDRIYVETQASLDGDLSSSGPAGVPSKSLAINNLGLIQARVAGPHTITVSGRGSATGTQTLALHAVAADVTSAATVGDQVDLIIDTPGQSASVTLDLNAGDTVTITNDTWVDGFLSIANRKGDEVKALPSALSLGDVTVPISGTYIIELTGRGATTGTQTITIE